MKRRIGVKQMIGIAATAWVLAGCGASDNPLSSDPSTRPAAEIAASIVGDTPSTLEADGLAFMREEEKLARDVYTALYERWNLRVFQNIARSEQTHTDAVLALLDGYGLSDPAAGQPVGAFQNDDLQALHDTLVLEGSASLEAALRVGAAIEEIDILDLVERIAQTDEDAIVAVYDNLLRGSENHLRAFTSTLRSTSGVEYIPRYLDRATYDAILSAGTSVGGGRPF